MLAAVARAFGITRGQQGNEPPTPYELTPVRAAGGIGVSNRVYARSHAPPTDSFRGRQGIMVLRTLNMQTPQFYQDNRPARQSAVLSNAAGANVTPELISLFDPKPPGGQFG